METIDRIVREMREHYNIVLWKKYITYGYTGPYFEQDVFTTKLHDIADRIEAAHRREIEKLRALVDGLIDATTIECASCNYDCGPNRENCIREQAIDRLGGAE